MALVDVLRPRAHAALLWQPALARPLLALAWLAALIPLVMHLGTYVHYAWALLTFPFDYDQGEGYDVNAGWLIAQGRGIYNNNDNLPYFSSNYPPLYPILVAGVIRLVGPSLAAGRLVSLAAAAALVLLIGWIVRRRTGDTLAGIVAALLFISSNYVYHVTPLARVNTLAALMALATVAASTRPGRRWALATGMLALLAVASKQTTIGAAGAALLVVALRERWFGVGVAAGSVQLGLVGFRLLDHFTEGQAYVNLVLGNANPWDPAQAVGYFRNFGELHALVLLGAVAAMAGSIWHRQLDPYTLYFAAALAMATSVGKWGAGESYFLEAIAAATVLAGVTLARLRRWLSGPLALLPPLLVVWQALMFGHGPIASPWNTANGGVQAAVLGHPPTEWDVARGWRVVDHIARARGPVLSENSGFLVALGRPVVGNATHLRNLYQIGRWDPEDLRHAIWQRWYALIILDAQLYPEPILEAIGKRYRLVDEIQVLSSRYWVFEPGGD